MTEDKLMAKGMHRAKAEVLRVLDQAVTAVLPGVLIKKKVKVIKTRILVVDGISYPLSRNVYLVGFGKAVGGMAYALEKMLGCRLRKGIVSVPKGEIRKSAPVEFKDLHDMTEVQMQELQMLKRSTVIEYLEGASGNQPDDASVANTKKIIALAKKLTESDTLIVLISGGGSALLSMPKRPLILYDKRDLCQKLQNAGASITELNRVRKQLSHVKAGGLAEIAYPAKVIAFILSDIVRDPIEFIASGPTCPPPLGDTADEAVEIMKKYNLYDSLDPCIKQLIPDNVKEIEDGKGMIVDGKYRHVTNILIGNNLVALKAGEATSKSLGLETFILSNTVEGDVKEVSYAYAKLTSSVCRVLEKSYCNESEFLDELEKKDIKTLDISVEKLSAAYKALAELGKGRGVLLLFGGEPTVIVEGCGKGGRNQELALRFSLDWFCEISKNPALFTYNVFFTSVGTDGQDGPTDAAGAFGEADMRPKLISLYKKIKEQKKETVNGEVLEILDDKIKQIDEMLPENVIKRNDSYSFYTKFVDGKYFIKTGLTGTNVMDLHFVYIKKKDCDCNVQRKAFACDYKDPVVEDPIFIFDEFVKNDIVME